MIKELTHTSLKSFWLIVFFLSAAILNHVFLQPKLTVALTYLYVLLFFISDDKYKSFYRFQTPWFLMFAVGLVNAYNNTNNNSLHDIFRDIFYFANPIIFIILGSFFSINIKVDRLLKVVVQIGTLLSIVFITFSLIRFGANIFNESLSIRSDIGVGNAISVLSVNLLLFSSKYDELHLINNMKFRRVLIVVNFLAIFIFGSRTYFGIFFILLISFLYPLYKQNFLKYFIWFALIIIGVFVILNTFKDNVLVEKILQSTAEISPVADLDEKDIYLNYRGYETYRAINTFSEGDAINKIFGYGFGKLVDLGRYIELGGTDWREIPVLHNGFAYMLVKIGIIGILIFLIYAINLFRLIVSVYQVSPLLSVMALGIFISMCFANYVISGVYNIELLLLLVLFGAILQSLLFIRNNLAYSDEFEALEDNDI